MALLVLGGAVALQIDHPADVETDIGGPTPGSLPALAADLDGWHIMADDTTATPDMSDVYDPASGSIQVFRRPDKLTGPSVFLHHQVGGGRDPCRTRAHIRRPIAGTQGYIKKTGSESFTVRWSPGTERQPRPPRGPGPQPASRSSSSPMSLDIKDPDIQYPSVEAKLGFVARRLPKGIQRGPRCADERRPERRPPAGPRARRGDHPRHHRRQGRGVLRDVPG